jgi:formamidopyrimidine-DNA glycosylase
MLGTSKEDEYSTSRLNTKLGAQRFIQRMRSIPQQRKIKDVLMNQGCVSGFGNIYASEALHLAGISPRRKLERIADAWLALLYSESISLFIRATMAGGSSVHSFRGPDGKEGEAQKAHRVYSREKCGSCDSPVRVTKMKGRTTYSCPQCQK